MVFLLWLILVVSLVFFNPTSFLSVVLVVAPHLTVQCVCIVMVVWRSTIFVHIFYSPFYLVNFENEPRLHRTLFFTLQLCNVIFLLVFYQIFGTCFMVQVQWEKNGKLWMKFKCITLVYIFCFGRILHREYLFQFSHHSTVRCVLRRRNSVCNQKSPSIS